jgi:hypothetical protein
MIFFDGFLDTYYAWDFNTPKHNERAFTTQPQRHNEPNINLVHAGINLKEEKFRGRFALQAGNSVEANTVYEANPDLGHIQESYLGIKLGEKTWLDGGIYLGNIGMESWISQKNMTYSRSMFLDYVPYYSLGMRLSHDIDSDLHTELHLMNGWQNISETNAAKSFGIQIKKTRGKLILTYNNFLGDENVIPGQKTRFRTYQNFIAEYEFTPDLKIQGAFDFGTQAQQENDGVDTWLALGVTLQKKLSESNFVAVRGEYYSDPHQSNVRTDTPHGFQVYSASTNIDHFFKKNFVWRNEIRAFHSRDKIYPTGSQKLNDLDGFIVTSISFMF